MDKDKLAEAAKLVHTALTKGHCTAQVEKLAADGFPLAMLGAMMQGTALKQNEADT